MRYRSSSKEERGRSVHMCKPELPRRVGHAVRVAGRDAARPTHRPPLFPSAFSVPCVPCFAEPWGGAKRRGGSAALNAKALRPGTVRNTIPTAGREANALPDSSARQQRVSSNLCSSVQSVDLPPSLFLCGLLAQQIRYTAPKRTRRPP